MRKEDDIRALFRESDAEIGIDEEKKRYALKTLEKQVYNRKISPARSRARLVKNQLYYMDKRLWAAALLLNLLFLLALPGMGAGGADEREIRTFSMVAASVSGTVSILVLARNFTNGIAELTETCYFDARQLVAMELTALGAMNFVILTLEILYVSFHWKIWIFRAGIHIAAPFFFTVAICLGCLMAEPGRNKSYVLAGAGLLSAAAAGALSCVPQAFALPAAALWYVGFAAGLAVLFLQIRRLFAEIGKGELLCADWN